MLVIPGRRGTVRDVRAFGIVDVLRCVVERIRDVFEGMGVEAGLVGDCTGSDGTCSASRQRKGECFGGKDNPQKDSVISKSRRNEKYA